jgi:hypothetical protein
MPVVATDLNIVKYKNHRSEPGSLARKTMTSLYRLSKPAGKNTLSTTAGTPSNKSLLLKYTKFKSILAPLNMDMAVLDAKVHQVLGKNVAHVHETQKSISSEFAQARPPNEIHHVPTLTNGELPVCTKNSTSPVPQDEQFL